LASSHWGSRRDRYGKTTRRAAFVTEMERVASARRRPAGGHWRVWDTRPRSAGTTPATAVELAELLMFQLWDLFANTTLTPHAH
jgi:hypothetical protein